MIVNISVKLYQTEPGAVKALFLGDLPKGTVIENGTTARLSWSDRRRKRRLNQNALYWIFINRYCLPAVHQYDPTLCADEIHEIFKNQFLSEIKIIKGISYMTTKSTTDESVSDFADYFNKCIEFSGSEFGAAVELFLAEYEEIKRRE